MIDLSDIIKKDNIIKVLPEDTLSHALSRLASSHDAAFVFDSKEKLLGVINPYYCLIKSSHPGNAKVEHCLYHPPHVYIEDSLPKVASLLVNSKIHYLPVFDKKENFLGIISARRLISHLKNLPIFKNKISKILGFWKKPLVVVYEDEPVSKAIHLFKLTKHSKLVVINRDMKLKGVLSYYDLISILVTPKSQAGRKEKLGNKGHIFSQHIKNFMKTYLLTLKKDDLLEDAFRLIIEKKIGSVIVIDDERHPISIITTRDLMRFFITGDRFDFSKFINPIKKYFQPKI